MIIKNLEYVKLIILKELEDGPLETKDLSERLVGLDVAVENKQLYNLIKRMAENGLVLKDDDQGVLRLEDAGRAAVLEYEAFQTLSAYDCSSLAWYSYYYGAGVTIPGGSGKSWPPVAGDEAKLLEQKGCGVSDLKPGDLIFWKTKSGVKNNRHKGIGHVAIYAGNKMMVEAMDERHGVCYSPVRSVDTIVSVCRPSML